MKLKQILLITGAYLLTTSLLSAPFTDNGDGTVKDNATGLVWMKCTFPRTYANGICSGNSTTYNWSTAITNCNGLTLAGKTWRLPNRNELLSLVDYTRTDVAIDISVFDNVYYNFNWSSNLKYYWSSSTYNSVINYAWIVDFVTGGSFYDSNFSKGQVALIRCASGP